MKRNRVAQQISTTALAKRRHNVVHKKLESVCGRDVALFSHAGTNVDKLNQTHCGPHIVSSLLASQGNLAIFILAYLTHN